MTWNCADGEFRWEAGPNSIQPNPSILRLAKDLDIVSDLVVADAKLPRFIFWNDKLHALPSSIVEFVFSFRLLSVVEKCRVVAGAVGLGVAAKPKEEESIRQFFVRHVGE